MNRMWTRIGLWIVRSYAAPAVVVFGWAATKFAALGTPGDWQIAGLLAVLTSGIGMAWAEAERAVTRARQNHGADRERDLR